MIWRSRILILYGSQTGQAESIAHEIFDRCTSEFDLKEHGIELAIYLLEQIGRKFDIEKETLVIFIVSTTGEGEPPDNALKFVRRIKKKTLPSSYLSHLNYGLLGLGDSNYNRFANFGKELDNRFESLGATKFIPTGFGDDAVGLEVGVEPWIDKLLVVLPYVLNISRIEAVPVYNEVMITTGYKKGLLFKSSIADQSQLTLPQISSKFKEVEITFTDETMKKCEVEISTLPVMESSVCNARIDKLKRLTPVDDGDKIIIEAEVTCDVKFKFVPGDSFGFYPGNRDEEVNFVLDYLGLTEKADTVCVVKCPTRSNIPTQSTPRHLIKFHLELRSTPKKSFLRHLADFCSSDIEKRRLLELSSREGAEDFATSIRSHHVNILDIFRYFPSCKPPLEVLLVNLPSFASRYYSAINYATEETDSFRIAFSVARSFETLERRGTERYGVFTGLMFDWLREDERETNDGIEAGLENLNLNDKRSVKVFKRKNTYFHLPSDPMIPLILVGPGTGVAPFIGFLEQRKHMRESMKRPLGQTWLFFGCRSKREFIYENELKRFEKDRVLHRFRYCFSRDESPESKHVQDEIKNNAADIGRLLSNNELMIYVCGDMKSMSTSVFDAFVSILEQQESLMRESAVQKMRDMQSNKKYLQDIWT